MKVSPKGVSWLKTIEKLHLIPYDDQTGKPINKWVPGATIGYGHLIPRYEWDAYKDGISETQANHLFLNDLKPFEDIVNRMVGVGLPDHCFDALVILAFNIGETAFMTSSVVKYLTIPGFKNIYGNLEAAWKAFNKSQGKLNKGLQNRRAAEWDMYHDGVYRFW